MSERKLEGARGSVEVAVSEEEVEPAPEAGTELIVHPSQTGEVALVRHELNHIYGLVESIGIPGQKLTYRDVSTVPVAAVESQVDALCRAARENRLSISEIQGALDDLDQLLIFLGGNADAYLENQGDSLFRESPTAVVVMLLILTLGLKKNIRAVLEQRVNASGVNKKISRISHKKAELEQHYNQILDARIMELDPDYEALLLQRDRLLEVVKQADKLSEFADTEAFDSRTGMYCEALVAKGYDTLFQTCLELELIAENDIDHVKEQGNPHLYNFRRLDMMLRKVKSEAESRHAITRTQIIAKRREIVREFAPVI